MSLALFLVVGLIAAASAAGDDHEVVKLWPGTPPDETAKYGPEATFPETDPTRFDITNITEPRFDVWSVPSTHPSPVKDAAVLVIPGGGYSVVSITAEGEEIAQWLNGLGLTAFVLKYRAPSRPKLPNYWVAQEDAQRAAGIIRTRAADWGFSASLRLGSIGFSAGGHCVATLAANPSKRLYARVDAYDDARCGPDFTMLVYPAWIAGFGTNGTIEHPSHVVVPPKGEKFPPTFGVQAEDDFCTPDNVMAYANMARHRNAKAEIHVFPEGGHGYGLRPSKFEVSTWPQRAEKWLRYLKVIA